MWYIYLVAGCGPIPDNDYYVKSDEKECYTNGDQVRIECPDGW